MTRMTVVEINSKPSFFPNLREAWIHRGLAVSMITRNIKLRYAQTALGALWVVIQPLLLTGTLSLVAGTFLSVPSDGSPYVLFAFAGTVIWSLFQRIVTETSSSMASSGSLILKVYFPRVLVPLSAALTVMIDILPAYALLVLVVAIFGLLPGWPILLSPVLVLVALLLALAIGLWVTMIDAIYRDVRMIVPPLLSFLFFLTPIMYADSVVPKKWEMIYQINPLVGLIRAFRWSMIAGTQAPGMGEIFWLLGLTAALLGGGLVIFARLEQLAVDRI